LDVRFVPKADIPCAVHEKFHLLSRIPYDGRPDMCLLSNAHEPIRFENTAAD
jgi:hypothetical protein